MKRKKFITILGVSTGAVVGGGLAFSAVFDHKTSNQPLEKRHVKLVTLDECRKELEQLRQAKGIAVNNDWTLYQNLVHCAQSIEYSYEGYPEKRSVLFQRTIGEMAFNKFKKQGFMSHNLNEPILSAPKIVDSDNLEIAFSRLEKAIEQFENTDEQMLRPHFVYGNVSKSDYAKVHAMHSSDHFSAFEV
ncbi:MAG: hypothetical protein ACJAWV_000176 [Flammeovirgaceae bacterium]|jgi:hypothetical protein